MPTVFFSYSHVDEQLRDELETQLAMLKRQGVISTWHDRRIDGGSDFAAVIDAHVDEDDIILLLVSPEFLASEYCYEREMTRAMQRHERGEAVVIPVILRACDWKGAPFGKLQATPRDGKPVTQWTDKDQAFLEVARTIRAVAERWGRDPVAKSAPAVEPPGRVDIPAPGPRSSNLRLTKEFSDRDRDRFKVDCFGFIARFFENPLGELSVRNPGTEGDFRRIDENRFTAAVYRDGKAITRCTVFMGAGHMNGIAFSHGDTATANSYNEMLNVGADEQSMFLKGMGMSHMIGSDAAAKMTPEGAAEHYWAMMIEPLQRRR